MKPQPVHILILAVLALTWGSSFILMHKAMKTAEGFTIYRADQVASMRLSLAAMALLPVSIHAFRKIKRTDLKWIALVGIVGSGMPAFLFTAAQTKLESAITGILNSLTPFFTLLIGIFFFSKKFLPRQFFGIVIGLTGAALLIAQKGLEGGNQWSYAFLVVLATIFYGLSINIVPTKLAHVNSIHISALSLLMVGIPCFLYTISAGTFQVLTEHQHGPEAMLYISLLAVLGTAFASYLYFLLAQQTSALLASSVAYLMPLVAVGWGIFYGEVLTWKHLSYAGLILLGVYLVNKNKVKPAFEKN